MGIFPYVLKLLQSNARELRPLLVFIWAKILSVDSVSSISLESAARAGLYSELKWVVCIVMLAKIYYLHRFNFRKLHGYKDNMFSFSLKDKLDIFIVIICLKKKVH